MQPSSLTPPAGTQRVIRRGPVFELSVLQGMISGGVLGEDEVWPATDRCEHDLENEQWDYEAVLRLLVSLAPGDYRKSEWCVVKGGALYPCDVYSVRYDFERATRNPRGVEVYLKFSVTDEGRLTLVLVSCHGSR